MNQDEQEVEYLDYVKPKRNRKKRDTNVRLEEQGYYCQNQGEWFKDEKTLSENKVQQKKQQFLTFQPDNTLEQYEHQLTYIQEQPETTLRSNRGTRHQTIGKDKDSSQQEGVQQIKKKECLLSALTASISKVQIQPKQSMPNIPLSKLQLPYFKSLITMQKSSLNDAKADILFLPFLSSQLQLYPGSILKDKLQASRQKLNQIDIHLGGIYMKGNHQVADNFRFLVFIKIDLKDRWKHLALGFNSVIAKIQKDRFGVNVLAFFVDGKYISASEVLKAIAASTFKKVDNPLQFQILTTDQTVLREESQHFQQFANKYSK